MPDVLGPLIRGRSQITLLYEGEGVHAMLTTHKKIEEFLKKNWGGLYCVKNLYFFL